MKTASELPLIVLIHGSWHQPNCFYKIQPLLEKQGYEVICPALPTNSKGQGDPQATHLTDVAALHEVFEPHLGQGKEMVIVGHSYGAVPGMVCVEGYSVEERAAQGKKGGIRAIIFLAGFALPVRGIQLVSAMDLDWIEVQGDWVVVNDKGREALYNGLPETEIDHMMSTLVPMCFKLAMTPVEFCAGDLKIPKTYVMSELDKALPLPAQEGFAAGTPDMKVIRVPTGHSSYLVMPDKVAEIIIQVAQESDGAEKE